MMWSNLINQKMSSKKGNKVAKRLMKEMVEGGMIGVCVLLDPKDPSAEAIITTNMKPGNVHGLFKKLAESKMKEEEKFRIAKPLLIIKKNNLPS